MWHKVSFVAQMRNLSIEGLEAFALIHENQVKFKIVSQYTLPGQDVAYPEVHTWYVNKLVKAYRKHIEESNG